MLTEDQIAQIGPAQPLLPTRPEQGRTLIIVLSVMALLAGLALLFARGALRLETRWIDQLSQTSTVQILIADPAARDSAVEAAQSILDQALPEARIRAVSERKAADQLRPWLGDTLLPDDLPIPILIEVRSETPLPIDALTSQFAEAGLRTVIDDHARYSSALKQTVGRLVLLGFVLIALILFAALCVTIYATRAGLASRRDIVHVLVQAGASDGFISRLFVSRAVKVSWVAAAVGGILAFLAWVGLSAGPARQSVGWASLSDLIEDGLLMLGLVALFVIVCAGSAATTTHRQLSDERRRA